MRGRVWLAEGGDVRSDSDEELVSCNALCLVCGGGKGDRGEALEGRTAPPRLRTSLPCTVADVHMEKVEVEERLEFRGLILGWRMEGGRPIVLALKTQTPPTPGLEKREQIPERRKVRESCLLLARL